MGILSNFGRHGGRRVAARRIRIGFLPAFRGLTVFLAAWFQKERVRSIHWLGIGTVFAGIAALSLQA